MTTSKPATRPTAPLRIGVLGCANIARSFIRDVAPSRSVRVVAVASRDAAKAKAFAAANQVPRHLASYEALLADPQVDAIYNPLPNSLHAEWSIKAAQHGKHVLCEKPLATSHAQAKAMFDAARQNGVMLLEAYPYWFQPQTRELLSLLHSGAIGSVKTVQAHFGFFLRTPDGNVPNQNIRMLPDLGGGALMDVGSYTTSFIRLVMGCAPTHVRAESTWASTGVDMSTHATLTFADGRRADFSCAMDRALHRQALVVGSEGVIETEFLNHTANPAEHPGGRHPWGHGPSQMRVRRAGQGQFEDVPAACGSGFRFAAEAFAVVVREGDQAAVDRAAVASLDIAATLQAVARSAQTGRVVQLSEVMP